MLRGCCSTNYLGTDNQFPSHLVHRLAELDTSHNSRTSFKLSSLTHPLNDSCSVSLLGILSPTDFKMRDHDNESTYFIRRPKSVTA